jgi:hypothetical protein
MEVGVCHSWEAWIRKIIVRGQHQARSSQDPILTNGWVPQCAPVTPATVGSINGRILVQVGLGIKWDPISKIIIGERLETWFKQ